MIDEFVAKLSTEKVAQLTVTNMYFDNGSNNGMRASNLRRYLNYFVSNSPPLILIGEAPGYKGCCVSGIPFTSTNIIRKSSFFQKLGINDIEYLQSEATASIIWGYLDVNEVYPLFWNAYPFHPHRKDSEKSNRKPTRSELELGKSYLLELTRFFPGVPVVAVGKTAHESLESMGIEAQYIRHPSHGGKIEFIKGLEGLLS